MIDKRLLGKVSNSFRYSRNIRDKIERDDDQISRQKSRLSQKSPDCIMALIDWGYCQNKLGVKGKFEEHQKAVEYLLSSLATLKIPGLNVSGKYSGVQILSRLIINSRGDGQEADKDSQ